MITDKTVNVKTDMGDYAITITGEQIGQTVRRRIAALLPRARILDMAEVDGVQGELVNKPRNSVK